MTAYTVIGARGFVGSHVVAHLRGQGIEPFRPVRDDPELWDRDLGRIFFCAGLTGDYRSRPFDTVEAHVGLVARLLERARFDWIVYLSSTRLYDSAAEGKGREAESIAIDAANREHLYELSKLLGENLTLHRSEGRGVVARLSYVFGWDADAQGFLSEWLRSARESRSLTLDSSPDYARDYIHVDDAAAALVAMANSRVTGIVNVACGEALSNAKIGVLFKQLGWDVEFARERDEARPAVMIDSSRLAAIGAPARPVLPLIGSYLGTLG